MKITKISASGLKGSKPFEHELAGVTVFTGANAAGKTTRLDLISLVMSGTVPGVSTKPNVIHEYFASGPAMECAASMEDGSRIVRSFVKDKKGSVKVVETFVGLPDGFAVPPVLLDPTVFLGMSAKERTKYLFRTLPPPSLDKVGPAVLVANIKNINLEQNTEHTEAVINDLCKWVADDWVGKPETVTVQEWLDNLVEKVRLRMNIAAATAKRMETTNAGLTQLKVDGASLAAAEQAMAAAQRALDEAKRMLNEHRGNYARAKKALDDAKALAATAVDETEVQQTIKTLEDRIAKAQACAAPGDAPIPGTMSSDRPSDAVARKHLQEMESIEQVARVKLEKAMQEVERLNAEVDAARNKTVCPTCGQGIVHLQSGVIEALESQLVAASVNEAALAEANGEAIGYANDARAKMLAVEKEIADWEGAKAALDAQNQAALQEHNAEVSEHNRAQASINAATAESQRLMASIAGNQAAKDAFNQLPALAVELTACATSGTIASEAVAAAQAEYNTAAQTHRQAIADRATAQSQARALAEADKARIEVEIVKQFAAFLNEMMSKIIEQSIQPLLETCNRICEGILRYPLALVDGEIGMCSPEAASGFVSWKTFSGAERSLTFAGLSVALSVGQPFKLVAIDEFGKLSAENKTMMLGRLLKLVAEKFIDQAVIVDPDTAFYRNVGDVKDFVCIEIVRDQR